MINTSAPKPYGDVRYADPKNGKYPIDTEEHARAAWSYINMPRNAGKYSTDELTAIKSRIRAACKKFGIKTDDKSTSELIEAIQKATAMSHVRMYEPNAPAPMIQVPQADDTFFYTGGRMLSYFPKVNENGMTFFRDDCKNLASTLLASMADVQHQKPNYPENPNNTNKAIGAICDVLEHAEGIDIAVKIEREVAKGLGFTPEDFIPDKGQYGKFSQECDFRPLDSTWIVVDRNNPSNIVKEVSYLEGLAQGYRCSRVVDGKWEYFLVDNNPVYVRIKPTSFSGVGHVINPADTSAQIYNYSADNSTKEILVSFFPGIDANPQNVPPDMTTNVEPDTSALFSPGAVGDDKNWMADDFTTHPDLVSASTFREKDDDGDYDDDMYAACYMGSGYDAKGQVVPTKYRALRIKSKNGDFDRKRLIAAYHALCGLRGDTFKATNLPPAIRAHALALVRQGLNETKPKNRSTKSTSMSIEQELEALKLKEAELQKTVSGNDQALKDQKAEYEKAIAAKEDVIKTKDDEIATLTAKVKEYQEKELSSTRLAELEKILAFTEDEKKEEKHEAFVKSLAAMSEDRFSTELLRRDNLRLQKEVAESKKAVASRMVGNPIQFHATNTQGTAEEDKLSLGNLY